MRILKSLGIIVFLLSFLLVKGSMVYADQTFTWSHGTSFSPTVSYVFEDDTIVLAGTSGKYEIVGANNNSLFNGTWAHGTDNIVKIARINNSSVLLYSHNGKYQVLNKNGTLGASGTFNISYVYDVAVRSNGDYIVAGIDGKYTVYNSSFGQVTTGTWGQGTWAIQKVIVREDNSAVLLGVNFGGTLWQILGSNNSLGITGNMSGGSVPDSVTVGNRNLFLSGHWLAQFNTTDSVPVNLGSHNLVSGIDGSFYIQLNQANRILSLGGNRYLVLHVNNGIQYQVFSSENAFAERGNLPALMGVTSNGVNLRSNGDLVVTGTSGKYRIYKLQLDENNITGRLTTNYLYDYAGRASTYSKYNNMIFIGGASGHYGIVNENGTIGSGLWDYGNYSLNGLARPDGTFLAYSSTLGRGQIINPQGALLYWPELTSVTLQGAVVKSNNEYVLYGENGKYQITRANNTVFSHGTWGHGTLRIDTALVTRNDEVLLIGGGNRFQIIKSDNSLGDFGVWAFVNGAFKAHQRADGKILVMGSSSWMLLNEDYSIHSYGSTSINGVVDYTERPNGDIVVINGGAIQIFNSNMQSVKVIANLGTGVLGNRIVSDGEGDVYFVNKGAHSYKYHILRADNTTIVSSADWVVSSNYLYVNDIIIRDDGTIIISNTGTSQRSVAQLILAKPPMSTLNVGSIGTTSIQLNWANTVKKYKIERSTSPTFSSGVVTIKDWSTGTTLTDNGLTPGTTYYYRIKNRNIFDKESKWSDIVTVKTKPATPAVVPTGTGTTWHQTEGRGKVVLNWPSVTGATGYKVYVWDGNQYIPFDVGNVTSWDSSIWKIYPTEAQLDSYANNSQSGNLFNMVKGGLDLRDTPNKLYNKTLGTGYNSSNSYYFRVTAYNESGEGDIAQSPTILVTLPNRTDNVAPTGAVVINDGSMKTGSNQVTLHLTSTDNASGVTEMSFSNDNISWTPWETVQNTKGWTITSGPGEKKVYVRYRDAAGNISNIISGSIYLVDDIKPPTVSLEVNRGQAISNTRYISLSISAHDDSSELPDLRYRVSADGLNWFNWNGTQWVTGWSSNFNVLDLPNWDVGEEEGVKYVYAQVRDLQGNVSSAAATLMHLKPTSTEKVTGLNPTDFDADTGKIILIPESVVDPTNVQGKVLNIKTGAGTSEPMIILGSQVGKLELSGSFAANNITQVRYSINGIIASAWESIPSGSSSIVKHVTFEGQGPQKVSLQFKNSYGVESRWLTMSYFVDTDAPEITDFKALNKATASVTAQQQLTAKDNVSKDLKYRTKADTGAWSSWSNIPTDGKISVTVASNTSSVIVEVVDLAGNVGSQSLTRPEFTDVTPPEIISLKTKNNASASKNSSIELVVLAKDDLSASLQYSVDGGAWQALPTNGVISANLGSTPGLKHISVTVRDLVGNVSTPQTISVWRVAS